MSSSSSVEKLNQNSLVDNLSSLLDKKLSLAVKGNIVTKEEFAAKTNQILEKISRSKNTQQAENLDYFKSLHSEILERIRRLEEKQLKVSDKLPCKQDIIDLTSKLDTTKPKLIETETKNLVESLKVEVEKIKQFSSQIKEELDSKLQQIEELLKEVRKLANGE